MKLRPVGAELFNAEDGRTDVTKLIVAFRNFANAPKEASLARVLLKLNSVALVRERTIPTERPPPVGEVSANFCG
jgi:hypothetical protein